MTDNTRQNNRPNVGENIRYMGDLVEKMLNDTANEQNHTQEKSEKTNPSLHISGNNNIISTDNSSVVVIHSSAKKLLVFLTCISLFF